MNCAFRIPENGKRVIWEVTSMCNYKCSYCMFNSGKKSEYELSTRQAYSVIDQLKNEGFTHLKITGGEPFMRKDIMQLLNYANDSGFVIDISTNGSLITNEIALGLKKIGLSMVHVSLDGYNKETHELVRGKNTYEPTIKGIKNLVNNSLYVRAGTVIFKGNENHLEEIVSSCEDLGLNEVIFSYMEPVGRMKDNDSIISKKSMKLTADELELIKHSHNKTLVNYSFMKNASVNQECPAITKFIYIDYLGKVSPCTWIAEKFPELKSEKTLKDSSLSEIIAKLKNIYFLSGKGCKIKEERL